MIRFKFFPGLVLWALLAGLTDFVDAEEPKTNVVFIVVDDLGWTDLGCTGSTFYETPHLDALAAKGMLINQAYATCPVCSPTRVSLATGRYPQRAGVTDYCGAPQPAAWRRNTRLLPAPYQEKLALSEVTLAERLVDAGYRTMFAGKWHLGPEGYWPENQGFELNYGGIERGGPYGGGKYFSPYGNPRLTDGPAGEHLPDRLATETTNFIRANREEPFFAYVCFYSVHTPLISREDLKAKYEMKRQTLQVEADEWGTEGDRKVRLVQNHAVYAGMVEAMDQAVGKIVETIQQQGLAERTVIIVTSDNGGLSTSEGHPTSNLPLRGGKGWMYEGGLRVPTLIYAPGIEPWPTTRSPTTSSSAQSYINSNDFYPTILELCRVPDSPNGHDGKSFVPLLRGQDWERGPIYWHYPHYGNQGGAPSAAIRDGQWKLIEWFETGKLELFNLDHDIAEQHDLADAEPERVLALHQQLKDWRNEVGAKLPVPNPAWVEPSQN
jgi:arylsulfatase A-like enzyme